MESKDDIKKRDSKLVSGNGADALLMTLIVSSAPDAPKVEAPRVHPKVFQDHFDRLRRRQEFASGKYIR